MESASRDRGIDQGFSRTNSSLPSSSSDSILSASRFKALSSSEFFVGFTFLRQNKKIDPMRIWSGVQCQKCIDLFILYFMLPFLEEINYFFVKVF
jgi:hypothetical protein